MLSFVYNEYGTYRRLGTFAATQFDLDKYEKDSFEWKRAMIKMLLELKKDGHEIKEIVNGSGNKVSGNRGGHLGDTYTSAYHCVGVVCEVAIAKNGTRHRPRARPRRSDASLSFCT